MVHSYENIKSIDTIEPHIFEKKIETLISLLGHDIGGEETPEG